MFQLNSYDHHAAIYLLLLERLRLRSISQDGTTKHTSLESQRRRPSSIAEQAMRKLGISSHSQISSQSQQQPPQQQPAPAQQQQQQHQPTQRSDSPVSPRHAAALAAVAGATPSLTDCSLTIDLNTSPLPSPGISTSAMVTTLTLRDTNIREYVPLTSGPLSLPSTHLRESSYFRGSTLTNSGINASTFLLRERDCSSPFIANAGQYGSLVGARENSCLISRENCITPMNMAHRTPSSRFLTSNIDQRIIKQSTEDCRRLLQQVHSLDNFLIQLDI